jgi:hypothetical protein
MYRLDDTYPRRPLTRVLSLAQPREEMLASSVAESKNMTHMSTNWTQMIRMARHVISKSRHWAQPARRFESSPIGQHPALTGKTRPVKVKQLRRYNPRLKR